MKVGPYWRQVRAAAGEGWKQSMAAYEQVESSDTVGGGLTVKSRTVGTLGVYRFWDMLVQLWGVLGLGFVSCLVLWL